MNRDIDSLKTMKKSELVNLALTSLDREIDLSKFDVSVSASRKYMYAYFNLKAEATYIPWESEAVYSFDVDLITGNVGFRMRSNFEGGEENKNKNPNLDNLYVSTNEDQQNLSFVLSQLKAYKDYGYISDKKTYVNILEKRDHFKVEIFYYGSEQYCNVIKGSGEITNEVSFTEAIEYPPGEPNPDYIYEEITD